MPSNARHITAKTDWSDKFDVFFDDRAALTMGNLIQALRKVTTVPDELERQFKAALKKRKFLVHHYFRERIILFTTERGRDEMIKDFEGYADSFVVADRALDEIVQPIMTRYGLTPEKLDAILKEMVEEQQSKG